MRYFGKSDRVSHTISSNGSPKSIPSTKDRKPMARNPAPITPRTRRCASCGGSSHKF